MRPGESLEMRKGEPGALLTSLVELSRCAASLVLRIAPGRQRRASKCNSSLLTLKGRSSNRFVHGAAVAHSISGGYVSRERRTFAKAELEKMEWKEETLNMVSKSPPVKVELARLL